MKKEEFFKYVKENILAYLPEDYESAHVELRQIPKNNDVIKNAIVVVEKENAVAPIIYLDDFYEEHLHHEKLLGAIMTRIAKMVWENRDVEQFGQIQQKFSDFEYIKSRIVMEVINAGQNKQFLQNIPYSISEAGSELAIIYKVVINEDEEGRASITVNDEHMKMWNVDVEDLHSYARENSNRICPAEVSSIQDLIGELLPFDSSEDIYEQGPNMYVITNKQRMNGASAMFYSDALKDIAEREGHDLFILPSSIHEVIAVSVDMGSPEELGEMVKEVNKTLSPGEVLSDHVFRFSAEDQKIKDVTEMSTANQKIAPATMNNPRHLR